MIQLIDYGAGNLTSVRKALSHLGAVFETPTTAENLRNASAVIVPGVGNFEATTTLDKVWRQSISTAGECIITVPTTSWMNIISRH